MKKYASTHPLYIKIYIRNRSNVFSNYIPINIVLNNLNDEDLDLVNEEVVNDRDSAKSKTGIGTFESIEELKYPEIYDPIFPIAFTSDELNEKEKKDPRAQAMLKRSSYNNISILIISQKVYGLPKNTY